MKTAYSTSKQNKDQPYPQYSTAREALEHFKFAMVLYRHNRLPESYIQHIKNEISRFEQLKDDNKQRIHQTKAALSKIDSLVETAVKRNLDNKDFTTALTTTKVDDGVIIDKYLIKFDDYEILYNITDLQANKKVYYNIYLYEIAYLLVLNSIDGLPKSAPQNKELLSQNTQYEQVSNSIKELRLKLNDKNTEDSEILTTKSLINQLKDQIQVIKQVVNAQYKHKINANQA